MEDLRCRYSVTLRGGGGMGVNLSVAIKVLVWRSEGPLFHHLL